MGGLCVCVYVCECSACLSCLPSWCAHMPSCEQVDDFKPSYLRAYTSFVQTYLEKPGKPSPHGPDSDLDDDESDANDSVDEDSDTSDEAAPVPPTAPRVRGSKTPRGSKPAAAPPLGVSATALSRRGRRVDSAEYQAFKNWQATSAHASTISLPPPPPSSSSIAFPRNGRR